MKLRFSLHDRVWLTLHYTGRTERLSGEIVGINVAKGSYRVRCSDGITRHCPEAIVVPEAPARREHHAH